MHPVISEQAVIWGSGLRTLQNGRRIIDSIWRRGSECFFDEDFRVDNKYMVYPYFDLIDQRDQVYRVSKLTSVCVRYDDHREEYWVRRDWGRWELSAVQPGEDTPEESNLHYE